MTLYLRKMTAPLAIAMLCWATMQSWAIAQDEKTKEQAALVEGLLDLLAEPSKQAPDVSATPKPHERPSSGANVDEDRNNPLELVRQSMVLAAGLLEAGLVNSQTRQVQSSIVVSLDDLISELEQSSKSQSSEKKQSQSQQQSQSDTDGNPTQQSTSSQVSEENSKQGQREQSNGHSAQDAPSQKGAAADAILELADPKSLQQNVWGQLPEQVRKQMQSRMVERFLPSYRAQIETYFQALLENSSDQ